MKSIIKIKFVDFCRSMLENNEILDILQERYEVILSDEPDFIIYSAFGNEHLHYDCVRIFVTGECVVPDFNECDYAIGFDRLQFGDRYARIPLYNLFQYKKEYEILQNRLQFTEEELKEKKGFCNFVYSNCYAQDIRCVMFKKLSTYKPVASGGRYLNNVGGPVADKKKFQSNYKFSIAFENTSYIGYTTEKIMEAFAARTLPIYYGDPTVVMDFNPKAFINTHDYASLDEVVARIEEIDNDNELYLSMMNEPIINSNVQIPSLKDFLYTIFDQPKEKAFRRSRSRTALAKEKMVLRHMFFEKYIYIYYKRAKSLFFKFTNGVSFAKRK